MLSFISNSSLPSASDQVLVFPLLLFGICISNPVEVGKANIFKLLCLILFSFMLCVQFILSCQFHLTIFNAHLHAKCFMLMSLYRCEYKLEPCFQRRDFVFANIVHQAPYPFEKAIRRTFVASFYYWHFMIMAIKYFVT